MIEAWAWPPVWVIVATAEFSVVPAGKLAVAKNFSAAALLAASWALALAPEICERGARAASTAASAVAARLDLAAVALE